MTSYQKISVVICTRNREDQLSKCIGSLLKQSVKPDEIIVVDDASDGSIDVKRIVSKSLASAKIRISRILSLDKIQMKYIRNSKRQGTVKSRNLGIAAASGDIVAFIDDDGFAHRDWVKNLASIYRNKNIAGVGGPVVEVGRKVETKPEFKRLSYVTRNGDIKHNYRVKKFSDIKKLRSGSVRFLMGGNMSFRRNALLKIGGFNEQYKGNFYREETDACMRVSRVGKVIFEPKAVAYHNSARSGGTRDVKHLENFMYWYFRNTVLLFFRNFGMRNAASKTWRHMRKYVSSIRKGDMKVNRDYLLVATTFKLLLAVFTGTIAGVVVGLLFNRPLKKLMYNHPQYALLITIALVGTSLHVLDEESIEIALKSVS